MTNIETTKGSSERTRTIGLLLVVILGMTSAVLLSRSIDTHRPPPDPNAIDESLYVDGKTARRMSLGFNGLVADWYWMRSIQYVGRKIMNLPENVSLDSLEQLNLKLLPALLDTATTLDPQFLDPYEYAAVVLPAINIDEAIRITKKGIDANPNAWRLYQHLGYIYWQQQKYPEAAEIYGRGGKIQGAPAWMEAMSARMAAEGGSRSTAREIYARMFEQSTDDKVKDMAQRRLWQLDSLDQRDAFKKLLTTYQARFGKCPANWKELEPGFRSLRIPVDASGSPVDPSGAPYVLDSVKCDVNLDSKSSIPAK